MKLLFSILLINFLLFTTPALFAQDADSTEMASAIEQLVMMSKKDSSLKYQTGNIKLNEQISLNIPKGYKFINQQDAEDIVYKIWNNPRGKGLLGMVVNEKFTLMNVENWAFVVSYDESGYVKDEDANDINYDDMMKELKESEIETNKLRAEEGYDAIHILGWASKPFYDKANNTLHWAKSMKFGSGEDTTLNYDVRILGRKGVLSMNAVGTMANLPDIKAHIPDILKIATFNDGSKYKDFNPSVDKVAAYTIGGLVAGKLLAKAGFLALILKNIKLVILGILGLFGGFGKKIKNFFSRKKNEEFTQPENNESNQTEL